MNTGKEFEQKEGGNEASTALDQQAAVVPRPIS